MVTYKIDEVAKQCGLTKRTIRYYEEIGLLPSAQRSSNTRLRMMLGYKDKIEDRGMNSFLLA